MVQLAAVQTLSNRDMLLEQWKDIDARRAALIEEERGLRSAVIAAFSDEPADTMRSGVESLDIGWGFDLKIEHKLDYKLDNANDAEATKAALDEIESSMVGGSIIAERLVKWKPELSISEYKKLEPAQRAIIDRVLTVKPASKSIKIHKRGK